MDHGKVKEKLQNSFKNESMLYWKQNWMVKTQLKLLTPSQSLF
jgi:hypothetical protein